MQSSAVRRVSPRWNLALNVSYASRYTTRRFRSTKPKPRVEPEGAWMDTGAPIPYTLQRPRRKPKFTGGIQPLKSFGLREGPSDWEVFGLKEPWIPKRLRDKKSKQTNAAITSLLPNELTSSCYIDISDQLQPTTSAQRTDDWKIRDRVRVELRYFRNERFPPNTGGFLYLHRPTLENAPPQSASLRFRVTNDPDPSTFNAPTSYDLPLFSDPVPLGKVALAGTAQDRVEKLTPTAIEAFLAEESQPPADTAEIGTTDHEDVAITRSASPYIAWSIPLVNPAARKLMPFVHHEFEPRLRSAFNNHQKKRPPTVPQTLYAYKQPFIIDLASKSVSLRTLSIGRASKFRNDILDIKLPTVEYWSDQKKATVQTPLFSGMVMACFERVPWDENLNVRYPPSESEQTQDWCVFIRVLKHITPIGFHPDVPKYMVPVDKVPWVYEGAPLPTYRHVLLRLHRPARHDNPDDNNILCNMWHWCLSKEYLLRGTEDTVTLDNDSAPVRTEQVGKSELEEMEEMEEIAGIPGVDEFEQELEKNEENEENEDNEDDEDNEDNEDNEELDKYDEYDEFVAREPRLPALTFALRGLRDMPKGTWDF